MHSQESRVSLKEFARRVWITVGIVGSVIVLLLALWLGSTMVLMTGAGLLLALALYIPSHWLSRHSFLSYRWALAVVLLVILGLLALFGMNFSSNVTQQSQQFLDVLPESLEEIKANVGEWPLGTQVLNQMEQNGSAQDMMGSGLSRVTSFFSSTLGALGNVVVVMFIGLFVAFEPWTYRNGLLAVVFPKHRDGAFELLMAVERRMSWWLLGRLASMMAIGLLTGIGLWLIGIPMALSLALLAAVLAFVPYLGPIISAIPALLVAVTIGQSALLYVVILYALVQFLESYLITPFIQREAVSIPPGLLIIVQLWLSLLAGLWGLLLAGPLTALVMVVVRHVYVDGWLREREADSTEPGSSEKHE
ncbi:AI-2E family transporter [Halomonas sp. Bachu 37]|uniref:AI-2E family transporter n=1 Tax=Halomonas kashgarensis TaxID=3084920 RepID=UPI00321784C9